jgi:hypothetical protein
MRSARKFLCWTTAVVTLSGAAPILAQTFAAGMGTVPVVGPVPVHADTRVNVPGHSRHAEETQLFGRVRDGVYTVDGMTAKVKLNYDVNGVNFLYLFVPGVGTAVVSVLPDPQAVVTEAKLHEDVLSFTVGEHRFTLSGVALASNKGTAPTHLYVKLDRTAWQLSRRPMVGFGNLAEGPYVWPGALPAPTQAQADPVPVAPPVPANLLPSTSAVRPAAVTARPVSLEPVALQ